MKKYGLPKTFLLRKNSEFEQVYKQGKRLRGDGFTLIYCKNTLSYSRLGISIHRQIKGAVKRNRIKRVIRESFRLERNRYPQHADIVVAIRPGYSVDSPRSVTQAISLIVPMGDLSDGNTD